VLFLCIYLNSFHGEDSVIKINYTINNFRKIV